MSRSSERVSPEVFFGATPFGPPNKLTLLRTLKAEPTLKIDIPPLVQPKAVNNCLRYGTPIIWRSYFFGDNGQADALIPDFARSPVQTDPDQPPYLPALEDRLAQEPELEKHMHLFGINPRLLSIKYFPHWYIQSGKYFDLITTAGIPGSPSTPPTVDVEIATLENSTEFTDPVRSGYEKFTFTHNSPGSPQSVSNFRFEIATQAADIHTRVTNYLQKLGIGQHFVLEIIRNKGEPLYLVQVRVLPPQWETQVKRQEKISFSIQHRQTPHASIWEFDTGEDLPTNATEAREMLSCRNQIPRYVVFSYSTNKHSLGHGCLSIMLTTVMRGGTVILPPIE